MDRSAKGSYGAVRPSRAPRFCDVGAAPACAVRWTGCGVVTEVLCGVSGPGQVLAEISSVFDCDPASVCVQRSVCGMLSTGYSKRQDLGIDSSFEDSHQVYNKAGRATTISEEKPL